MLLIDGILIRSLYFYGVWNKDACLTLQTILIWCRLLSAGFDLG